MNDQVIDLSKASEAAERAAKAITEFGHILAEAMKPILDAFAAFGQSEEFIKELRKQKYLTRYHRRGERMRKQRKL